MIHAFSTESTRLVESKWCDPRVVGRPGWLRAALCSASCAVFSRVGCAGDPLAPFSPVSDLRNCGKRGGFPLMSALYWRGWVAWVAWQAGACRWKGRTSPASNSLSRPTRNILSNQSLLLSLECVECSATAVYPRELLPRRGLGRPSQRPLYSEHTPQRAHTASSPMCSRKLTHSCVCL